MPVPGRFEGGGRYPPFKENFLQWIVGVNWGRTGANFVSGDFCCFERYVSIEKAGAPQNWQNYTTMCFSPGGGCFASTYGNTPKGPVFILGGHTGSGKIGIMQSFGGYKWTQVVVAGQALHDKTGDVKGLFWSEKDKLFYMQMSGSAPILKRAVYSPDGIYWFYAYSDFESYCDGYFKGIPDGVYGYDKAHDLVIYPGSNGQINPQSDSNVVSAIINATSKKPQEVQVDTGLQNCNCVTYCGGIWMAGGSGNLQDKQGNITFSGSMTTSSLDGFYWFLSTHGSLGEPDDAPEGFEIETIIGGPIQDFKNVKPAKLEFDLDASYDKTVFTAAALAERKQQMRIARKRQRS